MDNLPLFNSTEDENPVSKTTETETLKHLRAQLENYKKDNERLKKINIELNSNQEESFRLKPDKTFGLNVCGDVMLNKMEVEIINTPFFQRLAYVNQLGSTHTVYRSANHTRFEHSLGVLKKADLMISKIRGNKHSELVERHIELDEEQIIRLLALLHDIGHMPFGHTIEDEFNIFQSHDKHETRWEYFLGQESEIGKIIIRYRGTDANGNYDEAKGKTFFKRFYRLIKCEKNFKEFENDAFMYDIVSNTVCADLLDYLHRDSQYTNLKLNFHPRFLDYLIIKNVKNINRSLIEGKDVYERRIVIRLCKTRNKEQRKDIQSELVQLLRNRFYLGERVYYHHSKIKTGTLVAGAVARAKKSDSLKLLSGFEGRVYAKGDGPLYEIHTWGDVEMLVHLKNLSDHKQGNNAILIQGAKALSNAYFNRIIYHQLHSYSLTDLKLDESIIQEIITKKIQVNDKDKRDIFEIKLVNDFADSISRLSYEEQICEFLPDMKSGDFLIYFPNYKMQMKMAEVLIEEKDGTVNPLRTCRARLIREECEEIIKKHQDIWRLRVFIHPRFIQPEGQSDEETIKANKQYIQQFGHEYKIEYKTYIHLIEKYCNGIFAKPENQKAFMEDFWRELLEFFIDNELDNGATDEATAIYNPLRDKNNNEGKKNKGALLNEMASQYSDNTSAKRTKKELIEDIIKTFTQNHRK